MIKVEWSGGQSRYGAGAVDYMLAKVGGVELYAEYPLVNGEEYGTYYRLKVQILAQAIKAGIATDKLQFP